jgi:hypothetical protein
MTLLLICLGLPVTGVATHVHRRFLQSVEGHAWMWAHNVLGVLFLVFITWHAVLNRRALWNYFRGMF